MADPAPAVLDLVVTAKTPVADGVVTLTLRDPAGRRLPDWAPGAHVDLVLSNGLTRQYSLCGDRWDSRSYRVGVLREPDGRGGSAFIHDELVVGDHIGLGGPRNAFRLVPAPRYLFVAGGIGVTPILPMLTAAERLGADWRLIYGGRTRTSMAFLDELAEHGDRITVVPQDEHGLIDVASLVAEAGPGTRIYCCGPAPLLAAVETACAGLPTGVLRTERFSAPETAGSAEDREFSVELSRSGRTLSVPPGRSILDACADAGLNVLSSCAQGLCGTCETTVLAGLPDHRDSLLDDAERAAGDCMFICVSRARTDLLVLDL
ncbi:PDR/VanB family oxidoreductase [Actinocorallia longicatena]|uniref:PDR/VanB family oxidoreductase n=1 Tax=Actinocorallia longicatena TaxID=111803 RepID=A0ABP6PXE4_9ACTN